MYLKHLTETEKTTRNFAVTCILGQMIECRFQFTVSLQMSNIIQSRFSFQKYKQVVLSHCFLPFVMRLSVASISPLTIMSHRTCWLHLLIVFNHLMFWVMLIVTTKWVQLYFYLRLLTTQPHQIVVSYINDEQQ